MTLEPRCAAALLVALTLAGCSTSTPPARLWAVPIPQEIGDVAIGKEQALSLALAELRRHAGNDPWYTREHVNALLVRAGDRRVWSVTCSSSPIAGGGGRAMVDADTGEVFDLRVPVGTR
ncbi:MAG: hypothetical protein ACYSXF_07025 [Planctomycetota bacterium]|jgi:hypothetical protein